MELMSELLEPIIKAANRNNREAPGDYRVDGLLYCGKCHTPKETILPLPGGRKVGCACTCESERYEAEKAARKQQEEADRIMRLRSSGVTSEKDRNARFSQDNGDNPKPMNYLRAYVENWETVYHENKGLLLSGGVGAGKSFGAACIANALIDKSIPVCMVKLSYVLNELTNIQTDKNECIRSFMEYPLLILDDFGAERHSEFANEQIFNLIDERYRSGKPLIVTTNLSISALKSPSTLEEKRIYDRVLEMCTPILFGDRGRRQAIAAEKLKQTATLLSNGINGKKPGTPHA